MRIPKAGAPAKPPCGFAGKEEQRSERAPAKKRGPRKAGRRECAVTSVLRSKTSAEAEFTSAEHSNRRRVERPAGAEPKKKDTLSHVFLFGADDGTRTRTAVGH